MPQSWTRSTRCPAEFSFVIRMQLFKRRQLAIRPHEVAFKQTAKHQPRADISRLKVTVGVRQQIRDCVRRRCLIQLRQQQLPVRPSLHSATLLERQFAQPPQRIVTIRAEQPDANDSPGLRRSSRPAGTCWK